MRLTHDEKKHLLELARNRIALRLGAAQEPLPDRYTRSLEESRGAFVTLKSNGQLRGCIGSILGSKSLRETVGEVAVKSAVQDPRFPPLDAGELDGLVIEISVMTPLMPVKDWTGFVAGKHGVVLYKQGRTAVFLPQVATEYGWDAETTLRHLCHKAGLEPDDYREGAELRVFEAEVFEEDGKGGVRDMGPPEEETSL